MSYIELIIKNCIFLIAPLAIYLLYMIYKKKILQEENDLLFSVAIISSLYFILRFSDNYYNNYPIILFDIPLLICYFKRKISIAILVSFVLILYQVKILNINIFFLILEYGIYLIVYTVFIRKKIKSSSLVNNFIIVKSFMLSLEVFWFINPTTSFINNIIYLISMILIIYFITNLIVYIFDQGEKIVELNNNFEKIEHEKELRSSLFKVTHEIKNPIAVCKGYLDMLDVNNLKKVRKYIPIVKDEINRTLILMDDFLDYTKIKIKKEEMDLVMLFEELEGFFEALFKDKKISASFNIPDCDFYIKADYNRLKQVLVNMLKNSIEAKDINKDNMEIIVSLEDKGDNYEIVIFDNGIGMGNDELEKVRDMFFTTKKKGSGLGVSLSCEIIELHQGNVVYESVKDEFTKVIITLPKNINMS